MEVISNDWRLDLAFDARKGKLMSPMSIIISSDGRNARKLEQTVIEEEEYLQQYIHANPEALSLDQLKDNLRLLVLGARIYHGKRTDRCAGR